MYTYKFFKTDKTVKVFYNASAWDKTENEELKSFFKFICNNKAESSFTKSLLQKVRETIKNEEFIARYMAVNLHDYDIMEAGRKEGLTEGAREAKIQTAKNMLVEKIPIETIVKCTGLSIEEVKNLG
ncbi:hypothetical protein [Treponema sp.]|uniref:hypothetical protein n=1 Tax=Treponema sp. TaxID=166 RepID=UPI00258001DD|nr:hypothetical protein [Treponema sp.]MBE6355052.1 hypothetical protein [Treponema sp.]